MADTGKREGKREYPERAPGMERREWRRVSTTEPRNEQERDWINQLVNPSDIDTGNFDTVEDIDLEAQLDNFVPDHNQLYPEDPEDPDEESTISRKKERAKRKKKLEAEKAKQKSKESDISDYNRIADRQIENELDYDLADSERLLRLKPIARGWMDRNRKYFENIDSKGGLLIPSDNKTSQNAVNFLKVNNYNYVNSLTEFETPY